MGKHLFIKSAIVVLFGLTLYSCGDKQTSSDVSRRETNIDPVSEDTIINNKQYPRIRIYSHDLTSIYQKNEVKADQIFKGKRIFLHGRIREIGKDAFNNIFLRLYGDQEGYTNIYCYTKEEATAATLRKRQIVGVVGYCEGMNMGAPILRQCHIQDIDSIYK